MITLLGPHFVLQDVTENDVAVASICWGFTLGFGFITTWTAFKQTKHVYKRHGVAIFRNPYIWMIWLEIIVCLIFSIICWMYLRGYIAPSFAFYFCILTLWALQVQFLLQIIINRVSILLTNRRRVLHLKLGVAVLITAINISVYCIWIPARLQISEEYIRINNVWDRCEKCFYLIIDGLLNLYFVRIVQRNLVQQGLRKYASLVKFNVGIISFSLGMDILIIAMMSLNNTFVYMQFHPLAYIVKLKIEMSMADLIGKVARSDQNALHSSEHTPFSHSTLKGTRGTISEGKKTANNITVTDTIKIDHDTISEDSVSIELREITKGKGNMATQREIRAGEQGGTHASTGSNANNMSVFTTQEVRIEVEDSVHAGMVIDNFDDEGSIRRNDNDTKPVRHPLPAATGEKKGMGVYTKVWGA